MNFDIYLFDDFETLDVFGLVEVLGRVPGGGVADRFSETMAKKIAAGVEYVWNSDKEDDPFAELY